MSSVPNFKAKQIKEERRRKSAQQLGSYIERSHDIIKCKFQSSKVSIFFSKHLETYKPGREERGPFPSKLQK